MTTCKARQYSDQMLCECGLAWDMNDPDPPECLGTTMTMHHCVHCQKPLTSEERIYYENSCERCESETNLYSSEIAASDALEHIQSMFGDGPNYDRITRDDAVRMLRHARVVARTASMMLSRGASRSDVIAKLQEVSE